MALDDDRRMSSEEGNTVRARQAERERDRQKVKEKGLLGGVTDSLSGRDRGSKS
jgi:hypothetical protein